MLIFRGVGQDKIHSGRLFATHESAMSTEAFEGVR